MLPYQNIYGHNNTVDDCLNQCAYYGFPAGGMEVSLCFMVTFESNSDPTLQYGEECCKLLPKMQALPDTEVHFFRGCGDISDIRNNGGIFSDDASCNMPCSGDPVHICGGQQRLSLYYWDPSNPLNVWHAPNNTGRYEVSHMTIVITLLIVL